MDPKATDESRNGCDTSHRRSRSLYTHETEAIEVSLSLSMAFLPRLRYLMLFTGDFEFDKNRAMV